MARKLTHIWAKIKNIFNKLDRALVSTLTITSLIIMISCTFILISLTATQISSAPNPESIFTKVSNLVLSSLAIPTSEITAEKYRSLASTITGVIAVLVTLWFAVVTTVKHMYGKIEQKRRSPIKEKPVYRDGEDDLDIMHEYYRGASNVIVFSGDFSWISSSQKLKKEISRLSEEKKISFISYKSEKNVEKSITDKEMYRKIKDLMQFDSKFKIKCSLVQGIQSSAFLYKVDETSVGGNKKICIISGTGDARYLLSALSSLCEPHTSKLGI